MEITLKKGRGMFTEGFSKSFKEHFAVAINFASISQLMFCWTVVVIMVFKYVDVFSARFVKIISKASVR